MICRFTLSCCEWGCWNSLVAVDLRAEFDKIVMTGAKHDSLDPSFFCLFFGKGGVNYMEQNRGEGRRQCSDIKGERSSSRFLFIISKFSLQVLIRVWHEKII